MNASRSAPTPLPNFTLTWRKYLQDRQRYLKRQQCRCESYGVCSSCEELAEVRSDLHRVDALEQTLQRVGG